jgi:hypothetical protein
MQQLTRREKAAWRVSQLLAVQRQMSLPRRVALVGSRCFASVPVVFFALVTNRADEDVVADDLEENDVARATEWNDQFARATIAQLRPTA